MTSEDFEFIIFMIGHKIGKKDTKFRDAIPVREKLAVTLRFLASGDSYQSLSYLFKISKSAISLLIPEVCEALIDLFKDCIKVPTSEHEWLAVAQQYNSKWNFPHCLGSMDGKHVTLQAPVHSGSDFFNYKGSFSIVLFAIVDADYCFLYVTVGCQGRLSDGGVFEHTQFKEMMTNCQLNTPKAKCLPGSTYPFPHVLLADDAFPLKSWIMKPFPGTHPKGSAERIFNYRLSRGRRVVENAFGILSVVFRVLRKPMLLEPKKAEQVVLACTYLHNFLRRSKTSSTTYTPPGTFDLENEKTYELIPGQWRVEGSPSGTLFKLRRLPRKPSDLAKQVRVKLSEYFLTNEGSVPWQNNV
ncbi:uncharacterized protein LOC128987260 [Macrosteles quadrilineatus]|nr:uncharacterized protein LOC128987260 [Macrosteles quadrilineatus]